MALHGRNIIAGRPAESSSLGGGTQTAARAGAGARRGAGAPAGAGAGPDVEPSRPEATRATNPATGEELEPAFQNPSEHEIGAAVQAAAEATHSVRRLDAAKRAALLRCIGEEIMALGDTLIDRCNLETALPAARLQSERGRTVSQLNMFADLIEEGSWVDARIDTANPGREPLPKPDVRRMLIPIGPVAVFCASNFPLAFSVAGGDTASALAAGNAVVVKAHSSHPGTAELVGTAIAAAIDAEGLPQGLFSLLHGSGRTAGISLVRNPAVKAVGFTGSRTGGRALFNAAASRPEPIPVYAEMGSINPVFVLNGALRERSDDIAAELKGSVTLGVGQFCTNPGLVVGMESPEMEQFVGTVRELIRSAPGETMLNTKIRNAYEDGVTRLTAAAGVRKEGASTSGADATRNEAAAAVFSTDADTFCSNAALAEEVFGPSTLVVKGKTKEDLLKIADRMEGHLTATIHGTEEDLRENADLIDLLERKVGRLIFNGFPTGVEVCHAMNHGGPYPATTDLHFTSVGTTAIYRFSRPVCYQGFPDQALPPELQNDNPRGILRIVDGRYTREPVG